MATYCNACNKKLGFLDASYQILESAPECVFCDDCHTKYGALMRTSGASYQSNYDHFRKMLEDPKTPAPVKEYFFALNEKAKVRNVSAAERQARKEEEERAYRENLKGMMLTTGSTFEGYTVTKYIDVICEEVIFKNSFTNQITAAIENFVDSFSFRETELSGSGELISRARAYVKEKFCRKVASLGANAALGIEFESSIGADIVRVSISGTAVIIEKKP